MRLLRALPVLTLALTARSAAAQSGECPVDIYQPAALAQAGITISQAAQAATPADAAKSLRKAMGFLLDDKKYQSNLRGAAFLRAQIYVLWLHQDGAADVMTVEQLNDRGIKTVTVDLPRTADSLLKLVEAVSPSCSAETLQWRQAKPWSLKINKAYAFLNADALDSAAYYTDRAAQLYSGSPFVHNAYAQIASKRGDVGAMLTHLRAAIAASEGDTSLVTTRKQLQFQLAASAQRQAVTATGAEKAALNKEALEIYVGVLQETPAGDDAAYSFQAAAEIIGSSSDTAAAVALLAPMVADPTPYTDLTLLLAADLARMFGKPPDAIAMYTGALAKNANIRDANYFLSYLYYEAKRPELMLPLTDKLIQIDPSNADNYVMKALAYQLLAAAEKDINKKKEMVKTIETLSGMENTMPHRLSVTRFERRQEGAALEGAIENRGKTAKAYAVDVEFLDLQGNVLEAMSATVAPVKPGESGTFALTPTKPGIVAYRYAPVK